MFQVCFCEFFFLVVIFAWLLAFAVGNVGKLYNSIKVFERWFRQVVAVVFIAVGLYYVFIFYLLKYFS